MKNRTKKVFSVDGLKSIYHASREAGPAGKGPCPTVEKILDSFSPAADENDKFRIIDHTAVCSSCRRKFEAARELLVGAKNMAASYEGVRLDEKETAALKEKALLRIQELEISGKRPEGGVRGEFFRALLAVRSLRFAAVAILLLMAGLVLMTVLTLRHRPEDDAVRGVVSQEVRLEAPRGEWAAEPLAFRWAPYSGAGEYGVKLLDEELNPVWTSERTKNSSLALPADRSAGLEQEKTYYWKVIVYLKTGGTVESGLQEFRLKPR